MLNDSFNGTGKARHTKEEKERTAKADRELRERMRKPGHVQWVDRRNHPGFKLNPHDFIAKVYADRLGQGFTIGDLEYADAALRIAYEGWRRRAPRTITIDLPTIAQQNERDLAAGKFNPRLVSAQRWRTKGRAERNATPRVSKYTPS